MEEKGLNTLKNHANTAFQISILALVDTKTRSKYDTRHSLLDISTVFYCTVLYQITLPLFQSDPSELIRRINGQKNHRADSIAAGALTLLLIVNNVPQQEIIVTQHNGRSDVWQNAVHQVDFTSQLLTIQWQLLKAIIANTHISK